MSWAIQIACQVPNRSCFLSQLCRRPKYTTSRLQLNQGSKAVGPMVLAGEEDCCQSHY